MKQRHWIVLTIIVLVAVLCCGIAMAEIVQTGTCGAEGDNLTWTLDNAGVLTIAGTGDMKNFDSNADEWTNIGTVSRIVI